MRIFKSPSGRSFLTSVLNGAVAIRNGSAKHSGIFIPASILLPALNVLNDDQQTRLIVASDASPYPVYLTANLSKISCATVRYGCGRAPSLSPLTCNISQCLLMLSLLMTCACRGRVNAVSVLPASAC